MALVLATCSSACKARPFTQQGSARKQPSLGTGAPLLQPRRPTAAFSGAHGLSNSMFRAPQAAGRLPPAPTAPPPPCACWFHAGGMAQVVVPSRRCLRVCADVAAAAGSGEQQKQSRWARCSNGRRGCKQRALGCSCHALRPCQLAASSTISFGPTCLYLFPLPLLITICCFSLLQALQPTMAARRPGSGSSGCCRRALGSHQRSSSTHGRSCQALPCKQRACQVRLLCSIQVGSLGTQVIS